MKKLSITHKSFIHDDFLLNSETSKILYHEYAKNMPIVDFHCHISPKDIAEDRRFETITQLWLEGDHYKWRAMRANKVDENYCTGKAGDRDKFKQWASTVPYTLRNPLFHWSHLELKRYFGIDTLLDRSNADYVYDQCNEMLRSEDFSARNLLRKMNVELICTTDNPFQSLVWHDQILQSNFEIGVYPSFRPDDLFNVDDPGHYRQFISKAEVSSSLEINSFEDLLHYVQTRIDYFSSKGCKTSDHGLTEVYNDEYKDSDIEHLFSLLKQGLSLSEPQKRKYYSCILFNLGKMYAEAGWVQQYHIGALRNTRSTLFAQKGPDIGCDSMGDIEMAIPLNRFLDKLDSVNKLGKTILYNLNPAHNEVFASMIANFNDGTIKGKMQYGPAWWLLDQKDGIIKHLNTVSNYGLLAHFVGMVTDSRSLLSYTRHEYFRRILCDLLGGEIESGDVPNDVPLVGKMIQDICYYNSKKYFNF